jgi:hypothetical protein
MKPDDEEIDKYLSLKPFSFDFLERFELQQHEIFEDTYSSIYTLSVELWLCQVSTDEPHPQLRLLFGEVQKLNFQPSFPLTLRLRIRSLRQDQWEYLRYAVSDDDAGLSFYCRSFEASLVENDRTQE